MARASAGIRFTALCTALLASWLVAAPAQADLGDPVGGAVSGAGGDLVRDPVGQVRDTVVHVRDTTGPVTDSSDAPKDTVREVAESAKPSPQETASSVSGGATEVSQTAAETHPDTPRADASKPQNDRTTPLVHGTSNATSDASSTGPSPRRKARGRQSAREPASAVRTIPPTSAYGDSLHHPVVAERVPQRAATVPAPHVDQPCGGASLAVQDLLHCARAGAPIPALGGSPMILLPAGLVLVGMGLILVTSGRRRLTSVGPAS